MAKSRKSLLRARRHHRRCILERLESRHLLAVLFSDGFESGSNSNDWGSNWIEDSQGDWFRSTQRAVTGNYSAEVDGYAKDATLTLANAIDLSGYSPATLTFDWLIESRFDSGEYLALDVSSDGGTTWTNDVRRLDGNSSPENAWIDETVDLTGFASSELLVRFRSMASRGNEDANVDNVEISGTLAGPPDLSILDATIQEQSFPEDLVVPNSSGLSNANAMAIGDDGLLYLVSRNNDSVMRFHLDTGEYVDTFVATQSGGLDNPVGLAFGPNGDLFVSSSNTDEILQFDGATGAFVDDFVTAGSGGLDVPRDIDFEGGFLYVSSAGETQKILRYDADDGSFVDEFIADDPATTEVDESGGLYSPGGFAFDSAGNLYLAVHGTNQILRYDSQGAFLGEFVSTDLGGMDGPADVVFGPDGDLYVAAIRSSQVLRFDGVTGGFVNQVIGGAENVNRPRSILFDDVGNLLLASQTSNNVVRVSDSVAMVQLSHPSPIPVTIDFTTASGSAVAGQDFVSLSESVTIEAGETSKRIMLATINDSKAEDDEDFSVIISNATGGVTITDDTATITIRDDEASRKISIDDVAVIEGEATFHYRDNLEGTDRPRGLFVDKSGVVYVTSDHSNEVIRFDDEGNLIDAFVQSGSGELTRPFDIARGPDDHFYVSSENGDSVLRYDGDSGDFIDVFVEPGEGGLDTANGLTFGPDHNLYVASGATDEVLQFNGSSGKIIRTFVTAGLGGIDSPKFLTFGKDNNLYVSGFTSDNVVRYNGADGTLIDEFVTAKSGGLDDAEGIAFGPDGNFYVASYTTDEVLRYDGASGDFLNTYVPAQYGGIDGPHGIAFDEDGNLYVSSTFTDDVARYGVQNEAAFTISLSTPSNATVTVDYSTALSGANAATPGDDYLDISGQAVFFPGDTERRILVPIVDDSEVESPETFGVSLSNVVGGLLVDGSATATIFDDETTVQIDYPDFTNSAGLRLMGDATISGDRLRLTPAVGGSEGSAWFVGKQGVSTNWESTFDFNLNENFGDFGGSDGFTFIVQNHRDTYLAGGGGTLGYYELPNSLVIEFDTFQNSEAKDPSPSHISIHTNGRLPNNWDEALSLGAFDTPSLIDDATTHTARVSYVDGTLSVFLDDLTTPVISVAVDLESLLELDEGKAWVGFTATTGGGYQNHDILNWTFESTNEAPANQAPTVDAGSDRTLSDFDGSDSESVELVGSATDSDGSIASVQWSDSSGVLGTDNTLNTILPVGVHALTFTALDDLGASSSDTVVVTVEANLEPSASAGADQTVTDSDDDGSETVTLVGEGSDSDGTLLSYVWKLNDVTVGSTASISPTLDIGTHVLTLIVTDEGEAWSSDTVVVTVEAPLTVNPPLIAKGVAQTSSSSWATISLAGQGFVDPVVIATPNYDESMPPMVTRITNVGGGGFDLKVQPVDADATEINNLSVHYIVVEAGTYTVAENGIKMEARTVVADTTAENNDWNQYESVGYAQTYSNPVVVGQVMSTNDTQWSSFWSSGSSRTSPPSSSTLRLGKHVGEDSVTDRAAETVGFLVIESGSGEIGGLPYVAGLGSDSVAGMGDSPSYDYSLSLPPEKIYVAAVSQAGMDGGNGGWAVLYGDEAVTPTQLRLAIEEDQINDSERRHTSEQVAYFIIDPPVESDTTEEDSFLAASERRPSAFRPQFVASLLSSEQPDQDRDDRGDEQRDRHELRQAFPSPNRLGRDFGRPNSEQSSGFDRRALERVFADLDNEERESRGNDLLDDDLLESLI